MQLALAVGLARGMLRGSPLRCCRRGVSEPGARGRCMRGAARTGSGFGSSAAFSSVDMASGGLPWRDFLLAAWLPIL